MLKRSILALFLASSSAYAADDCDKSDVCFINKAGRQSTKFNMMEIDCGDPANPRRKPTLIFNYYDPHETIGELTVLQNYLVTYADPERWVSVGVENKPYYFAVSPDGALFSLDDDKRHEELFWKDRRGNWDGEGMPLSQKGRFHGMAIAQCGLGL